MIGFLALLPRSYGSSNSIPIPAVPLTLLGWSLTAFLLASAALLADLGVEWNRRNRDRAGQAQRAVLQDGCLVRLAEFQLEPGESTRARLREASKLLRGSLQWVSVAAEWFVPAGASSRGRGVGGQPGGEVGRALEIKQGVGQGFELLQGQGLDLDGGGF
jgi:hypothetical protein